MLQSAVHLHQVSRSVWQGFPDDLFLVGNPACSRPESAHREPGFPGPYGRKNVQKSVFLVLSSWSPLNHPGVHFCLLTAQSDPSGH